MTIVPSQSSIIEYENLAVSLPRYANIIQMKECAFWGVNDPNDPQPGCDTIWTKWQRDMIMKYLAEAQDEIEQVVRYPLSPKYFVEERQNYLCPLQTNWGKVISSGIKATVNIQLGAIIDHTTDPAVIIVPTTITDINEIIIYHPGTDFTIIPSSIVLSGGNAIIKIPRCRLVATGYQDNPEEGWDYSDVSGCNLSVVVPGPFECIVDVKQVYTDTSVGAELVCGANCNCGSCCGGCEETTNDACMYVKNAEIGSIVVKATACGCCNSPFVRLNYLAGMTPLTPQAEDAIVRLAHSKMPNEVCGCETWMRLWRRDRFVPEVLTRERLNCPFGLSDGSWISWRFTQMLKLVRGDTL
jgi:hypothetical protein